MNVTIEYASHDEVALAIDLLERTRLPTEGVREIATTLYVARRDGRVIGCAALEVHGTTALVRSVAVDPSCHRQGLGRRLVSAVEDLARRLGLVELFLLTETAAAFFAALGYASVDRQQVPAELQASPEFTRICPTTACVMRKALRH